MAGKLALCPRLRSFGVCARHARFECGKYRHELQARELASLTGEALGGPACRFVSLVPDECTVRVRLTHIIDLTHFHAQLLEARDVAGVTSSTPSSRRSAADSDLRVGLMNLQRDGRLIDFS